MVFHTFFSAVEQYTCLFTLTTNPDLLFIFHSELKNDKSIKEKNEKLNIFLDELR